MRLHRARGSKKGGGKIQTETGRFRIRGTLLNSQKIAYYDLNKQQLWWVVHSNKKTMIMAVKDGSAVRYSNLFLEKRYNSKGEKWVAYEEFKIEQELP